MSVITLYNQLYIHFNTEWANRCKLFFPNVNSSQVEGVFTDTETVISFSINEVSNTTRSLPQNQNSLRLQRFLLICNIETPIHQGDSVMRGHADRLDQIFLNKCIITSNHKYNFEESILRQSIQTKDTFFTSWQCPFFVFIN